MKSLVLFGLFFFVLSQAYSATVYSKQERLNPIHLTQKDVKEFIGKTVNRITNVNSKDGLKPGNGKLTFRFDENEIEVHGEIDWKMLEKLPPKVFSMEYFTQLEPEDKISYVFIRFDDYERTVAIKGTDQDEVNSLYFLIKSELDKKTAFFSGSGFRIPVGFILFILISILGISSLAMSFMDQRELPKDLRGKGLAVWGFCFGSMLILLLVPFNELLPGFVIYSGSVSFIERNQAQIGFWGIVVGVIFSAWFSRTESRKNRRR